MSIEKYLYTKFKSYLKNENNNNINKKIDCIYNSIVNELNSYNDSNLDDRWVDLRQEKRKIDAYYKDGYFLSTREEINEYVKPFLANLNYSDKNTYKKENVVRKINGNINVYKAIGDKILFRAVSLTDWERIKKQGYIDSDMRGAIIDTEGINLAQIPNTAIYYLPHNNKGVILAIEPKELDLYMLSDEYIRVFEPIDIKNVIRVSDVFIKNSEGGLLSFDTDLKINQIIDRLTKLDLNIKC